MGIPGEAIAEIGRELREECGVFAVWSPESTRQGGRVIRGLNILQHRGQDACGIVLLGDEHVCSVKNTGKVEDIPRDKVEEIAAFIGRTGSGHVRYGTVETDDPAKAAGPNLGKARDGRFFYLNHNGTIVSQPREWAPALTDSARLAETFGLQWRENERLPDMVRRVLQSVIGGFALTLVTRDEMIGVVDPNNLRPLILGQLPENKGFVLASESPALEIVGARIVHRLDAGEMVHVTSSGRINREIIFPETKHLECSFESIYFARPDAMLNGNSAQMRRYKMGELLASQAPVDADIVVGVPDSGIPAAQGYAYVSGIRLMNGLVRNRYGGDRSFIQPSDDERVSAVRRKLLADPSVVDGKRLIVVDDSIVRGNTSREIVEMFREAGAIEVHGRISSPTVTNPCYYGIATGDRDQLMASDMTVDEMRVALDMDTLVFLSHQNLNAAIGTTHCGACFGGEYPTKLPIPCGVVRSSPVAVTDESKVFENQRG